MESLERTAQNSISHAFARYRKMYRATSIRNFKKAKVQTNARQAVQYFFLFARESERENDRYRHDD
jgi:hypothetical protein